MVAVNSLLVAGALYGGPVQKRGSPFRTFLRIVSVEPLQQASGIRTQTKVLVESPPSRRGHRSCLA